MEKLDYLVWRREGTDVSTQCTGLLDDAVPASLAAGALALTVHIGDTADEIPSPPLLMGRGAELAAVVCLWLDSIDERGPVETALRSGGVPIDGYLVTESVPQRRPEPEVGLQPGVTHFTWFPKPDRLSDDEFFRGWHEVHTPSTTALHPLRVEYVRDSVARTLTADSPQVNAIVFERFAEIEDYANPRRLFGSREAIEEASRDLPLYADLDSINSRPLHEVIIKSL